MTAPLLIYDGDCGFCTSAAEWMRRRLGEAASVQPGQRTDMPAYGLTSGDATKAVWFVDAAGGVHRGHRAVAEALRTFGGAWPVLGRALLLPPISWCAALGYGLVVRFRHHLPGATPACRIDDHS